VADGDAVLPALLDEMSRRLAAAVNLPETILMGKSPSDRMLDAVETAFFARQLEYVPFDLYPPGLFSRIRIDQRSERTQISMWEIDSGA